MSFDFTWWTVVWCSSVIKGEKLTFDDACLLSFPNSRRFLLAVRVNDGDVASLLLLLLNEFARFLFGNKERFIGLGLECSTSGIFVDKLRCCIILDFDRIGGIRFADVSW